jgi:hypothetical protein
MLATPVLAERSKRVPVDMNLGSYPPFTVTYWLTGDVQHGSATILWGDIVKSSITGDGIDLQTGTAIQTTTYSVNVEGIPTGVRTGKGVVHNKLEITFSDGKFVGNSNSQGIFKVINNKAYLYTGSSHGVLRGTGEFLGWTLVFSGEVFEAATVEFEAYMFTP